MDATEPGLQCGWAGCLEEFDTETDWIGHVSIHVFTLKPGERTPWLGLPDRNPYRQRGLVVNGAFFVNLRTIQYLTDILAPFADDRSDGEDDDDDYQGFSQINALSSPASTPPQAELPDSPDLSEKINGPSASMVTTVEPLRLLRSPDEVEVERTLSNRTSGSADDVEAGLMPTSPSPSTGASQNLDSNASPNRENPPYPHLLSHGAPVQTQSPFSSYSASGFRRGTFQIGSPAETPLRFGFGMGTPQSQSQPVASQTLRSPGSSQISISGSQGQMDGNGMSWLNTQAFRAPETQDQYESD